MKSINEEIAEKIMGWHKVQESCFPEAWHREDGSFAGYFVDYESSSLPGTFWNPEKRLDHAMEALEVMPEWSINHRDGQGYMVGIPGHYNKMGPSKTLTGAICNALL